MIELQKELKMASSSSCHECRSVKDIMSKHALPSLGTGQNKERYQRLLEEVVENIRGCGGISGGAKLLALFLGGITVRTGRR